MTLISLIRIFKDGPAVSLNGSPTVSPVTAALWVSEPFPPKIPPSMYFLALSQAPAAFDIKRASITPETVTPARTPPSISGPPTKPTITGVDTASSPGMIISLIAALVAISTHFANNEEVTINFDPENGELRVFTVKKISKNPKYPASEISLSDAKKIDVAAAYGNYIEIDLPSKTLGRIAAQAAKQVILKKVKNAEQEKNYVFFTSKLGEIVSGALRRFGPNHSIIFESNKTEILLPEREMLPGETFVRGDRIKASVIRVLRETYGPQVIVSRINNIFLAKLLETEIPEIANGNIEIKDIVRQPGERAKIAVLAKEKDIDPIGACIGLKGNRILSISKELFGEKYIIYSGYNNLRAICFP